MEGQLGSVVTRRKLGTNADESLGVGVSVSVGLSVGMV